MNIELQLIEMKDLREEYINRIEVLEKVKNLILLPDIMLATTQQVADFYEVDITTMWKQIERNKDEIISDGYTIWKAKDFISDKKSEIKINKNRGSFDIEFSNGQKEKFAPRGVALFTRRAILRVGMLLRDSKIAKEVRTQLLNIEEHSTIEQKTVEINKELEIQSDIGKAILSGNIESILVAFGKGMEYKNRHIINLEKEKEELGTEVNVLTHSTRTWSDRSITNALMRAYAIKCTNKFFPKAWNELYRELKYKKGIDVNARLNGKKLIDRIKDEEWSHVLEVATALCKSAKINVGKIINEINESNIED